MTSKKKVVAKKTPSRAASSLKKRSATRRSTTRAQKKTHSGRGNKLSSARLTVVFSFIAFAIAMLVWFFSETTATPIDEPVAKPKSAVIAQKNPTLQNESMGIRIKFPPNFMLDKDVAQREFMLKSGEANQIAMKGKMYKDIPNPEFPYSSVKQFIEQQKGPQPSVTNGRNVEWYCIDKSDVKSCLAQRNSDVLKFEYLKTDKNVLSPDDFGKIVSETLLQ